MKFLRSRVEEQIGIIEFYNPPHNFMTAGMVRELDELTRDWAAGNGFTLFPEAGYESQTLTCVNNGAKPDGREIDVPKLQGLMKERGILIDGGYGKIKGKTFRLSSMGDETEETMQSLYGLLDESLGQL